MIDKEIQVANATIHYAASLIEILFQKEDVMNTPLHRKEEENEKEISYFNGIRYGDRQDPA